MAFVLIEGDNGTGKTTISQKFFKNGFFVVTDCMEVKELENRARTFQIGSNQRMDAFIEYNRLCGKMALEYKKSLVVRYWISTVAASYADNLLTLKETLNKAVEFLKELPVPDFIFRLKCDYEVRKTRIITRNNDLLDVTDDITIERDKNIKKF